MPTVSDESTSTDTTSSSTDSSSDSSISSRKGRKDYNKKYCPKWRKYWTETELCGRYVPITRHTSNPLDSFRYFKLKVNHHVIRFEGKSTCNSTAKGIQIDSKVFIDKLFSSSTFRRCRILRELRILRTLSEHPSIIKLYDAFPDIKNTSLRAITMILQYTDASLYKVFRTNQYFSSHQVQYILYQMILAVQYIHHCGIVNRHLWPRNISIRTDCSIQITDFDVARGMFEDFPSHMLYSIRGCSLWYRAPEVLLRQQKRALPSEDIWSIGCIFAELLQMEDNNCPVVKRGPLFPVHASLCPSLRRRPKNKWINNLRVADQIRAILDLLGTATQEEISSFNDKNGRRFLEELPHQKPQNFTEMLFPGSSCEGMDLLTYLLKFDMRKRLNVVQVIKHPYFNRVRDVDAETVYTTTKFDFEEIPSDEDELCDLILKEISELN